jgi:hypothetical protein
MSYPTIFATLAAGNQPASLIDTMFNIAGQQGNIPCTAAGSNAITLSPGGNYYVPAAYTNAQIVSFKAGANSTGNVTIQVGGLALIKLFTAAGVQAASGDIVQNTHYAVQYWSDLDSGAGGFIILNATVTAIANPVVAEFSNLVITVTANNTLTVTADAAVLQNAGGGTVRVTSASVTINTGTAGANGLDTGSIAASKWYAVYLIRNTSSGTTAGMISLGYPAPTTLPSGYNYYARLGWVATDASTFLLRTKQLGKEVQYVVTATASTTSTGGNTPAPILIVSGTAGTFSASSPVLASYQVTGNGFAAPTTAAKIAVLANTRWKTGSTDYNVLVAPSVNYGGTNNGPSGSNGQIYPIYLATGAGQLNACVQMVLESANIGVAISGAQGAVACLGWTDNL